MWPFKRRQKPEPPLLPLTPWDSLTMHQAYEGILGIGGTGSGKSTTLQHLMLALMEQGAGMSFLTAKGDDYAAIERMAKLVGKDGNLLRFHTGGKLRFDFLNYELSAPGGSLVTAGQLMQEMLDFSTRTSTQNEHEPFWPIMAARKIRMAMALVYYAKGQCSIEDVYTCCTTMPNTPEQRDSAEFKESPCFLWMREAVHKHPDNHDLGLAVDFVLQEWCRLSDRTAGCVDAHVINLLEKFMHGSVHELVASGVTNISPAALDEGKLIVIDTPILTHREPGQFVQMVWKLSVQRHALRRPITADTLPIVSWADEAQLHALPSVDSMVQAVARSHKLIQVAITQNIPLLKSVLKNQDDVYAWLSNLQTKFIFSNADPETNSYFSALLGASKQLMGGSSMPTGKINPLDDWFGAPQSEGSYSTQEQWLPDVRPEDFTRLRKGGKSNEFVVDFYVTQGGRVFSNGKTWLLTSFLQMV
jgi:energy-coupling factor transporter ATP-binding protein EcfA2